MSNLINEAVDSACRLNPCDAVEMIIEARARDLGGFSVRRVLPFAKRRMVGPWIFFDHMGPASFTPGNGIDVRPHPHINLATVTYLFEGEIFHRDSLGSAQGIRPGDINLMVAGRGIVHSERTRPEVRASGQNLHGLQLWLALPAEQEEIEPAFHHYPSADIPKVNVDGVPGRVMMGQAWGVESPVLCHSQTLYAEARLKAGQSLPMPGAPEQAIYVASGEVSISGHRVSEGSMAVLRSGTNARLEATKESYIAIIGGESLGERVMYWNFVSSRPERLEQAKTDWKEGRFPLVPGDEKEFIPLPGDA